MGSYIVKKICMLGDIAVGKTSLVKRYVYDAFSDDYLKTLGTKIVKRIEEDVPVMAAYQPKTDVNMIVWDINHKFVHPVSNNLMIHDYVRGCTGALFVVDSTSRASLNVIKKQVDIVYNRNGWVPMVFVANKEDIFENVKTNAAGKEIDVKKLKSELRSSLNKIAQKELDDYVARFCDSVRAVDPDNMLYPEELEEISKLADSKEYVAPHFYASALMGRNVRNAFRTLADVLANN